MEPCIDVITLAVADLDRALGFYRDGLGLESPGVIATEFAGDDVSTTMAGLSAKSRNGHGLDRLLATARLAGLALAQALPA